MKKIYMTSSFPSNLSLMNLPPEMELEIMKRVGQNSHVSFVNAKAASVLMRDVSQEISVLKNLSFNKVPLFVDDKFPYVENVMYAALGAGNLKVVFRLGVTHCLYVGEIYEYGCHLISRVARKKFHKIFFFKFAAYCAFGA